MNIMANIPAKSIDFVLTSPPYAEQRKSQYQSISETLYPQWTCDWMEMVTPLLKNCASVAIVIRTNIMNGHISDYVLRTRILLHDRGWVEPEELMWIKPNSPPLGSLYRPRRSWEQILWFAKSSKVYCDTRANGKPSDRIGMESKKGVGKYISGVSQSRKGIARRKDYFEIGTSSNDRSKNNTHPAQFPLALAEQVINMLCPRDGTVLDPFVGSGTTALAAKKQGRNFLGIEISEEYCNMAKERLSL